MFLPDGIQFLQSADMVLAPLYFFFIILFAFLIRNVTLHGSPMSPYFMTGMLAKIVGGIVMGAVYAFYYKSGDTFYYFYDSKTFNLAIEQSADTFFKLLFLHSGTITTATYDSTWWLTFFHDPSGWMADKVYGVISIFCFHSYPVMSIIISVLSFSGAWALYRTFVDLYPQLYKPLAYCVLFVPSVFFWGSGVLKDSITFGCVGWITAASYNIFFKRRRIVSNAFIILFCGYIALEIKAYIIISFAPALMFWIFLTYRSKMQNQFLRVVSGPAVFTISVVFGYIVIQRLGQEFSQFSLQSVLSTAQQFQAWHSFLAQNENASGYSLGNVTGSWQSILIASPRAVSVTLFQPFLWQAHSSIMLASALESMAILFFTLYIFYKNGLRRPIVAIVNNPTVFFCFLFSIIFAFCVGFTAYNFGALVRYKIPCIPFYLMGLVILNHLTAEERKALQANQLKRRPVFSMRPQSSPQAEQVP